MDRTPMMLLGTLEGGSGSMACLIGVERGRLIVVAQNDLSRYSWPVDLAEMSADMLSLVIAGDDSYLFTPDLPDRFRWVMTAALQEATSRRAPWWRRSGPSIRGLERQLTKDDLAA